MRRFLVVSLLIFMSIASFGSAAPVAAHQATPGAADAAVPLGETGTIGSFGFTVDEFLPNANDLLDPDGPDLAPGKQLVDITLTMTNTASSTQWFPSVSFLAAGNRAVLDTVARYGVCKEDGNFWDVYSGHQQFRPNESVSYHLCSPIASGDVDSLRLALQDISTSSTGAILWFDLGSPDAYDPNVAADQSRDALDRIDQENPAFDDPAAASDVVSNGDIVYEVKKYDDDATSKSIAAGAAVPVDGMSLALVEVEATNISDRDVSPSIQLLGQDGIGYESLHEVPSELQTDLWSIELLPGGQATITLLFPVRESDAGNRLLYLSEDPQTVADGNPAGAWLNPGNSDPEFDALDAIEPGIALDPTDTSRQPFGTRVALDTLTVSLTAATFPTGAPAQLHLLVENHDREAFVLDPDLIVTAYGDETECQIQDYAGGTNWYDPIGILAPNASIELVLTCNVGVSEYIYVANYLVTAPQGVLTVSLDVDPAAASTPQDVDIVATIAANPPGHHKR